MARGRRCCCCQNIYYLGRPEIMRVSGGKGIITDPGGSIVDTNARGYFDFVNKFLYTPNNINNLPTTTTPSSIYRVDENLTSRVAVFQLSNSKRIRDAVATFPWNNHIYYACRDDFVDNKIVQIRRVNYDGTNDTLIVSRSDASSGGARIFWITFSRNPDFVFYSEVWGGHSHLRRCELSGANDTLLIDYSGVSNIPQICVNNDDKYIFYPLQNGVSITIRRAAFDGTGDVTILDRDASIPPFPSTSSITGAGNYSLRVLNWSHSRSRLFFSCQVVFAGANQNGIGVWSCKADGSDITQEVVHPNITINGFTDPDSSQGANQLLGCGFETTGANTKGT